ncbi:MAG: AMP-binding protein, partial [Propionibacterium sp.]|nr:AMP-binding protein [Propionibacterium sp.]
DLAPGSRIGLLGVNSFFWIAAYLAAMRVGVVVPMSEKLGADELATQAEFVECAAILADRRQLRSLGDAFGSRPVITDGALAVEPDEFWPEPRRGMGDDAALMFTSGTTSRPKVVRLTHRNLIANTTSIVEYLELGPTERVLVILPFHYVFGASLLHTHLAAGGSVVICNTFTFPETAIDLIARHACTGLAGVPSSYQLLLKASSYASRPLPSLKKVQQAGGRLAPELLRALRKAQPTSEVYVMYGQTEATARLSYLPPELLEEKLGSIGRGIPGVELVVEGEDGRPIAPGEQGEIVASGANISPGYYRDDEATREKFRDGKLRTGDLATVDEDGFIHIVGRSGDFIKSWGYRISPQQVDETALLHEGIQAAVTVGLPDPDAGEAVTLAVTPAPGVQLDEAAVLAFLRGKLPKHMVPARVHVLEIPLTTNGKVSRSAVRELLQSLN